MAETIESFVAKLQAEGVQAGRQAAEKLLDQAKAQAEEIISEARKQAEEIKAQADKEAAARMDRAQTELTLAARDAVLRLRDALRRGISRILAAGAQAQLADAGLLREVIRELVTTYAKADADGRGTVEVNVTPETRKKLVDWVIHELEQELVGQSGCSVNLRESLRQEGFELRISGSTVEVTLESVVNALADLVSPALRELLEPPAGEEGK